MNSPDPFSPDSLSSERSGTGLMAVVAAAAALGITALLIATDAFDALVGFLLKYENWQFDELLLGLVLGMMIYACLYSYHLYLRNRSLKGELSRQQRLLRRVADLSDGLVLHNRDLERAVWIMSREFSDPLRVVQRHFDHLGQQTRDGADPDDALRLRQCQQALHRISALSQALGDYLGGSSGHLLCHPVDCQALVQEILEALPPDHGATIRVEPLPKVFAHHGELLRVLRHLIKNALRFRRMEIPLLITVRSVIDDQFHCLEVEDNGIGVSADNLETVFRLIPNVNQQTVFEGHGLGLASCRRAAHRMNGRLWLEQSPSGGCLFRLRLPKA